MTDNTPRNMLRKPILVSVIAGLFLLGGCGDSKSDPSETAPKTPGTTAPGTTAPGTTNASTPAAEQSEAERTLRRFVQHLAETEFEQALELSDPSSAGYSQIESQLNITMQNPMSADLFRPMFSGTFRDAQIEPVRIEDNRARFQLTAGGDSKTIDMQKRDGAWLVLVPEGLVDMAVRSFRPTGAPPRN